MGSERKEKRNKGDILIEESSFEYFIFKIKTISFQVLSVLLKDEDEDLVKVYGVTIFDYLQMHTFPFHLKLQHLWKATAFLEIIFEVFGLFNVKQYMPKINFDTYIMGIYFLDGIILLIILDILYVAYSFSQKKFSITWPLKILNEVASYFVTILFLPITENLFSVLECEYESKEGHFLLGNFPDVQCWTGWMLVHQIVTSLFNILFIILSSIVALAFFEPRMTSKNKTARQDSLGEVIFIIAKVACQLLFNFVPEGNDWTLSIFCFIMSISVFWSYNIEEPYYDKSVGKFFDVISTYYLWTNIMLIVSLIFYETSFNGGLIIWILGLPFISLIMITTKRSRIETLVTSQMKFRSGEQVQGHIRYVLELIDKQKNDKNSYMLLIGYVEKHKELCQEEDCHLKIQNYKRKKHLMNDISIEEVIKHLLIDIQLSHQTKQIKEIGRLYQNGLKKFPSSTKLRLSYAFFLYERLKQRELALVQFQQCRFTKPTFDEQFIIFRYIELISSSQGEVEQNHKASAAEGNDEDDEEEEEENDVVKRIEFDSHISQCEDYMKLAAIKHKEFWSNLKEEHSNIALGKLNILGSGISQCVHKAKDHFNGMVKINPQFPQPYKVYGQFLLRVLNQRESGIELIEKSRELLKGHQHKVVKKYNEDQIKSDPRPFLVVDKKKQANSSIQSANLLFTILFGFQKEETIGKELGFMIPHLYQPYHEDLIEQMQESSMEAQFSSDYLDIPQNRFGLNRGGYIVPITYTVSTLNLDFTKFVVLLEADLTHKNSIFILTNDHFMITDITSSVFLYFDITISMIHSEKELSISSIIVDWEQEQTTYQTKGKEFSFNEQAFNCICQPISLQLMDHNFEEITMVIGYQFKIDKIEKPIIGKSPNIKSGKNRKDSDTNSYYTNSYYTTKNSPMISPRITDIPLSSARGELQSQQNLLTINNQASNYLSNLINTPRSVQNGTPEEKKQSNHNEKISKMGFSNVATLNNIPNNNINSNTNIQQSYGGITSVGSLRSINMKKKNLDDSESESFPIILVDQRRLDSALFSDRDIQSPHYILGDKGELPQQTAKSHLSRFIFDFYKMPDENEEDSFGDFQDDAETGSTFNKKYFTDYAKDIKTKRLINNEIKGIFEDDYKEDDVDQKLQD